MSETITRGLGFPKMGASLMCGLTKTANGSYDSYWYIFLTVSGPNFRYNSGSATISQNGYIPLLNDLKSALEKISILETNQITGGYRKAIGNWGFRSLSLNVVSENNDIYLNFGVSSQTQTFYRKLYKKDVEAAITALEKVPEMVSSMIADLKKLV
jgi:hypothetical protein